MPRSNFVKHESVFSPVRYLVTASLQAVKYSEPRGIKVLPPHQSLLFLSLLFFLSTGPLYTSSECGKQFSRLLWSRLGLATAGWHIRRPSRRRSTEHWGPARPVL